MARQDRGVRPRDRRFRRAVTLLLMTLVAPGSAQLVAGHRGLGRVAIRVYLGLLGLAVILGLLLAFASGAMLGLVTNPTVLVVVRVVLVVLAACWLGLFVDAWRLGRPLSLGRRHRLAASGVTACLSLITVGALLMSSQYVAVARGSIVDIFGHGTKSDPLAGRYNVLLLGGDAGPDRVGLRPDSLTLVSIDEETGGTAMFSFPRNLQNVPFPKDSPLRKLYPHGYDCGNYCLLNAVYTLGEKNKDLFPAGVSNPGLLATKQAVEQISGLNVNYTVMVDMHGFSSLVDALGGLDITVRKRLPIGGVGSAVSGWLEPGRQHLDGYHALWFARSRESTSDYDRMARQRCVMAAMLNQLRPMTVVTKFRQIAEAGRELVSTDIPVSELDTFVSLARKARKHPIESIQFVPPLIVTADPDYSLIRKKIRQTIADSRAAARPSDRVASKSSGGQSSGARSSAQAANHASGGPAGSTADSPTGGTAGSDAHDLSQVCAAG